ncbi:MAG: addiction module protein [Candidatus Cloacimonetes bacterium]|nr:addiction module protein [Candidatus Cloacimonadota bacterium]
MRPNEIRKEIDNLALAEKLILVEDIWDSIAKNNNELPLPEWQKLELDKRYNEYKNGELNLHDVKSAHKELRNRYK